MYEPELGQMLFGNKWESHEMPKFAVSMFDGLIALVGAINWNVHQKEFKTWDEADLGPVHYRPYNWNAAFSDDDTEVEPNFWHDEHPLRIRWYKHPGRGMSCNMDLTPADWALWHDTVHDSLWAVSEEKIEALRASDR